MKLNEIFDSLYDLYSKPHELRGYDRAYDEVPYLAWGKIIGKSYPWKLTDQQIQQLKEKEHLWMQDKQLKFLYALYVMKDAGYWHKKREGLL